MIGPRTITPDMLDERPDFERGMSPAPRVSIALIAVNLLAYALEAAQGATANAELLAAVGAKKASLVAGGESWRLLSSNFLHGSTGHLVGNMAGLYILGMGCEHAFGGAFTFAAYVGCGVLATLLSCLSPEVSVGASGAIFGLLGALAVSLYRHRDRLAVRDRRTGLVLVSWAIYAVIEGALDPRIDNLAHAGGLLSGAAVGLIGVPLQLRPEPREPGGRGAAVAAAAAACLYTAWYFLPALGLGRSQH